MFDGFKSALISTADTKIFVRWAGTGPPLLLLHGFPQTHLMWHKVAPRLSRHFTVVCMDLRGYGRSGCPRSSENHAAYSKRALADDALLVMKRLGFPRFCVAGHDRGGRVAYRLALDHPKGIERVAALDVIPTAAAWDRADARFAIGFWPWSFLAQSAPLPERLIAAAPEIVVENALSTWGTPRTAFSPAVRAAYVQALRDPKRIHAICEEYRAAAGLDRDHDRADERRQRRITCPLLVLWSKGGPLDRWYRNEGGPLRLWKKWATTVTGRSVPGGHFFPERSAKATAAALQTFFSPRP